MSNETDPVPSSIEQRLWNLEHAQPPKTWCDILQAVGPILIAIVAGFYTWNQNAQAEKQQAAERGYQNHIQAVQFQSDREKADNELRGSMFSALVGQLFKGDLKPQDKFFIVELFEDNFQESFHAGPLFAMVYADLPGDRKEQFRKLAASRADKQALALGAGQAPLLQLVHVNDETNVPLGEYVLGLKLLSVTNDSVGISVIATDTNGSYIGTTEFNVSYFDMPMTDNTKLPNHHRFAVTLKSISSEGVLLKVFDLPRNVFFSKDRPTMDELAGGTGKP